MKIRDKRECAEFYLKINKITNIDDCWELLVTTAKNQKFTHTIYGYGIGPSLPTNTGLSWISNFPLELMDLYLKSNSFFGVKSLWWNFNKERVNDWSTDTSVNAQDRETIQALDYITRVFGVNCGFTVPVRYPIYNIYGGLGFSATNVEKEDYLLNYRPKIPCLVYITKIFIGRLYTLDKYPVFTSSVQPSYPKLTNFEKSILRAEANGIARKVYANKFHFRDSKILTPIFSELQERFNTESLGHLINLLQKTKAI